jgi:ATP-dependent Clp protease ATP-binding subunit ClpC
MFGWLRRMMGEPVGERAVESSSHLPDPYSRFTDRALKVMQFANHEALRFNHEYVGTEHVLLGLIQVADGVAVAILRKCGVSTEAVRREVERLVQRGPGGESLVGRLPHTPRAEEALRWTSEEARFLSHDFVGTEHILMGLLHTSDGVAAVVLNSFGLTADRARDEVIRLSPPGRGPRPA